MNDEPEQEPGQGQGDPEGDQQGGGPGQDQGGGEGQGGSDKPDIWKTDLREGDQGRDERG